MFKSSLDLYAPEFILEELANHNDEIQARSGLDKASFEILYKGIMSRVTIIPKNLIESCIKQAFHHIGKRDPKDVLYLASYLCVNVQGIWTNDPDFSLLDHLVFTTSDILKFFNLSIR